MEPASLKTERICLLGAGSWGATLATLLAENGHSVSLWEFNPRAAESLQRTRRLSFLPDLRLAESVQVTSDLAQAVEEKPIIVSATPSQFVRSTMRAVHATQAMSPQAIVISVSKGLEEKTLKRMSQIIAEELGLPSAGIGVLSGPSHAEEVCRHLPTATVVASSNAALCARAQSLFRQDHFRVYIQSDIIGVEMGGTLKNVFAIACGISDGLGLGDNTKAAIMTRGLNEMSKLGVKMGAQLATFFGLAGMGDLIVTCLSRHSRNRLFGEKIGAGLSPQQALTEMTMVTEGFKTALSAYELAHRLETECPLTHEIYQVLFEAKDPRDSLQDLMSRETQQEWQGLT